MACLGAVILIAVGVQWKTFAHKILALKPIVGIGLISYSLYLWHWPLLSLYSYQHDGVKGDRYGVPLLIALSFVLSAFTWRYVERPFRDRQHWQFKSVLKIVLASQVLLLILGIVVWQLQGIPQRFTNKQLQHYYSKTNDINPLQISCQYRYESSDPKPDIKKCLVGAESNLSLRFVIWGDSHANALTPVFGTLGKEYGVSGIQASYAGGASLINVKRSDWTSIENQKWQDFNQRVIQFVQQHPAVTDIFLVSRWMTQVFGYSEYELRTRGRTGRDENFAISSIDRNDPVSAFQQSLQDTVSILLAEGKRVWIVLPVPEVDRDVPRWLAIHGTDEDHDIWIDGYPSWRQSTLLPIFEKVKTKPGIRLLDPIGFLCRDNNHECRITTKGNSLYLDDNHLSATGSVFLSDMLRPAFEEMSEPKLRSG